MGNDFMASAAQSYAKEVRSQFERYATWLPNEIVVNVGDIGVLHKNIFYKEANVKQLGINLPTSSDPKAKAQYKFTSKGTAQVSGKASASGIPTSTGQISSTLEISFSDEHSRPRTLFLSPKPLKSLAEFRITLRSQLVSVSSRKET
jgi:hypothetical protein